MGLRWIDQINLMIACYCRENKDVNEVELQWKTGVVEEFLELPEIKKQFAAFVRSKKEPEVF